MKIVAVCVSKCDVKIVAVRLIPASSLCIYRRSAGICDALGSPYPAFPFEKEISQSLPSLFQYLSLMLICFPNVVRFQTIIFSLAYLLLTLVRYAARKIPHDAGNPSSNSDDGPTAANMVLKRFPLPAVIDRPAREVTVAATQMSLTWDLEGNMVKAEQLVRKAAAQGAQIILLQVTL